MYAPSSYHSTKHNIFVDHKGTVKLSLVSFARLSANIPSSAQTAAPTDDAISARYLSPELLQDDAWPSPHSDMWSLGCVACWASRASAPGVSPSTYYMSSTSQMYIRRDPYPDCASEHLVVRRILDGHKPFTLEQMAELHLKPDTPWLTNGIWALIQRCWNQDGAQRPSAASCSRQVRELLERAENEVDRQGLKGRNLFPVASGVKDLSGKVSTTDEDRKRMKFSSGMWRQNYGPRLTEDIDIRYRYWKGMLSQGFLWWKHEVTIKGIFISPGALHGVFVDSAKQCVYHEIALLRQIKHENICEFMGYDDTQAGTTILALHRVPAIITEFCSNGELGEYCARRSHELTFEDRLDLVKGVAKAMGYLHQQVPDGPIVHGNLSTDTILVSQDGTVKLSNFEFACQYEHSDNPMLARTLYAPHITLNPSRWHAPELFNETSDSAPPYPTQYSDLWALGCIFMAVLTGQLPYERYDLPRAIGCIAEGVKPFSPDICSSSAWNISNSLWATPPHLRISAAQALDMISLL